MLWGSYTFVEPAGAWGALSQRDLAVQCTPPRVHTSPPPPMYPGSSCETPTTSTPTSEGFPARRSPARSMVIMEGTRRRRPGQKKVRRPASLDAAATAPAGATGGDPLDALLPEGGGGGAHHPLWEVVEALSSGDAKDRSPPPHPPCGTWLSVLRLSLP